ncbi:MAG: hypothetical protein KQH63_11085 [Desulfobulbaceae bacterium]|nr:hypothetical protein [Desulfobulbaceae bacterium]
MILIVKAFFTRDHLKDAAKSFTQLPRLPNTVKRKGPFFHFDEKGDIHALSMFAFSDPFISNEQRKFVENRLKNFSEVQGFTYTVEEWMSMEEALAHLKKNKK